MRRIEGYCDGSASPNPGAGGWACLLVEYSDKFDTIWSNSGRLEYTTNNIMELTALVELLKMIGRLRKIDIYLDSQYVLLTIVEKSGKGIERRDGKMYLTGRLEKWIANGWRLAGNDPVKNLELWKQIYSRLKFLSDEGIEMTFHWVKSHSGNKYNEMVDMLANEAREGSGKRGP